MLSEHYSISDGTEPSVRGSYWFFDLRERQLRSSKVLQHYFYSLLYVSLLIRLRNHDLLTSLDVLTTGSYRRLPTNIKVGTYVDV